MKLSKVGKMIGVSRRTVYNWVTHPSLEQFFSEEARKEGDRDLDEEDVLLIMTIKFLRDRVTTDWEEIAEKLEGGFRESNLSVGALEVDTGMTPLALMERNLILRQERDEALRQRDEAKGEIETIRVSHASEKERLMREIAELNREIGRLEARLEIATKNDHGESN